MLNLTGWRRFLDTGGMAASGTVAGLIRFRQQRSTDSITYIHYLEALVEWLCEEAHAQEVVGSDPGPEYKEY